MLFRVSPHRHSQSLSRDVPSTIRLPSAIIVPENDDEKDDEKSTKKEIEEDLTHIFVPSPFKKVSRVLLAFLVQSEVLLLFSPARAKEGARDACDSLRLVALCVRQKVRDRSFFFFDERKREDTEEKKKYKKKQNP